MPLAALLGVPYFSCVVTDLARSSSSQTHESGVWVCRLTARCPGGAPGTAGLAPALSLANLCHSCGVALAVDLGLLRHCVSFLIFKGRKLWNVRHLIGSSSIRSQNPFFLSPLPPPRNVLN